MNTLIPFAATGLFAAGVTTGIIGVVTLAIRREEKNLTLTGTATDRVTRAGRQLNGVGVRVGRRDLLWPTPRPHRRIARDDIARWLESWPVSAPSLA